MADSVDPAISLLRPCVLDDFVRLGRGYDGGYVVPQRAIEGTTILVGMGVDVDWSFEADFLVAHQSARLVAVDGSTGVVRILRRSLRSMYYAVTEIYRPRGSAFGGVLQSLALARKAIGFAKFFRGPNRRFIRKFVASTNSADCTTWSEICKIASIELKDSLFVKIDIEGAEYDVLPQLSGSFDQINGLVVEYHEIERRLPEFTQLQRLLSEQFVLVHAHCNNYTAWSKLLGCTQAMELTYLNRSLLRSHEHQREFAGEYYLPEVDRPCDPKSMDFSLFFPAV